MAIITRIKPQALTQGKKAEVRVSIAEKGNRKRATFQTFITGGFTSLVTVGGTFAVGDYVLTVAGTIHTYVAILGDNNTTVRDGLIALVNGGTTGATAVSPADGTAGARTFVVERETTFVISGSAPVGATLTAAAVGTTTPPAKGDTSIPITGTPAQSEIQVGNTFMFISDLGEEVMATLSAKTTVGATSLTVFPLDTAIAAGSRAEYPSYMYGLTDSGVSRTFTFAGGSDYNTGNSQEGIISGGTAAANLPGNFYQENPGRIVLEYAADREIEVIVERSIDGSSDKKTPLVEWFAALVTSIERPAPSEGFIGNSFALTVVGKVNIIESRAI